MTVQVRVGRYSGFSVGIKCNLSDLDAAGRFVLGNGLPDIVTAVLVQCVQLVLINIKLVEAEILHDQQCGNSGDREDLCGVSDGRSTGRAAVIDQCVDRQHSDDTCQRIDCPRRPPAGTL